MSAPPTSSLSPAHLRALIAAELPELIAIRHDLHAHPELGYAEHRTSGVVQRELERAGIEHRAGLAQGTGVLGSLPGRAEQAVGLRADMDALPIEELTGAEYASTNPGVMHACGHDGHTTVLIGAARVLARLAREHELPRPVTFVFQPAEEGGGGGRRMVEDGCLHGSIVGPPVETMFGLHGWPTLALGHVATRPGPMLAAADRFDVTVRGTGCHAAYPHVGRDPVLAGAAIVQAVQQIAARNVGPLDSIVVSVTQFHGGTTHNIIPGEVHLTGTVRTLLPETQDLARERLRLVVRNVAAAHGCDAELEYHVGYPVTLNHPDAVEAFRAEAGAALGPDRVAALDHPVMGGEDFAFYGQVVPACFFALGLIPPGRDRMPDLHQPDFDFNDDAIPTGIEVFVRLATRA
ncbi:MAG: M20 metallopeptidase family protein [Planctomycetota bacterium]|jgi:amidohydrolase